MYCKIFLLSLGDTAHKIEKKLTPAINEEKKKKTLSKCLKAQVVSRLDKPVVSTNH